MDYNCEEFYQQDFTAEQALLNSLRDCLDDSQQSIVVPSDLKFSFDPKISHIYITLFQEGSGHLRWGSKRETLADSLERVLYKLRGHKRFQDFSVSDPDRCRIMLEIVTDDYPCDPKKLTTIKLNENRLEPGIHGLKFQYQGTPYYYMPTDAITNSLMTIKQVFNYLSKRTGVAKKTNSISDRAKMMRSLITDCKLIKSFAVISSGKQALPLYRGYPVPVQMNRETLRECIIRSTDWVLDNMKPNGQFLYYYDGVKDSEIDFQHPGMTNPTYYNILRHSGGTITLLRAYELTGDQKYLEGAKESLDFFLTVLKEHEYQGHYACYPFFNRKSKLGGAGIGLVSLLQYFRLTGDDTYNKYIHGLVFHILSRVSESGELIGYFIHPSFYNGKEIIDPDEETKKELFSFYYPGEALLGLALYILHMPDIDPNLLALVLEKSKMALDFLIHERPRKYHYMFDPLPADGWLMQAIEEWIKIEGFADQSYIDFVYNDTQAMIDHMYQEHNAPFFDYTGTFYYHYGEHAYPDGARCEGLISAYYLARHLEDDKQAEHFMQYISKAAKSLLYTLNTPESCYAHKRSAKSINSFRFKLTRQWMRVDSVQHTACFYARLYPVITDQIIAESVQKKYAVDQNIDGLKILKKIEKGGFATVYLVEDGTDSSKHYALKQLHKSKYNFNRILREVSALKIINNYKDTIKCYRAKVHQGELYFLFDYARDGDLRNHVKNNGVFDQKALFKLLHDILEEIVFAKEHNLFHLDISIFNIILFNHKFSLIDWGLSNFGSAFRTTVIKGHRTYLAPEIYNGERTLKSEIYSLGATLYYASTGKVIFDIHTQKTPIEQKMFKHCYYKPNFPDNFPGKIKYLLLRMLEKDPETRATVDEIRDIMKDDFIVPDYTYPVNVEDEDFDLTDTFVVYKKMAEDGICHAQWQMGVYCENGKHVTQSFELARYWYNKAAGKDYSLALCSLALLYLEGRGVVQDQAKAFSLLENGAKQGHGKAQYYFARMFENGMATKKDLEKSVHWYTESAKNSYRKAIGKLDELKIDLFHKYSDSLEFSFQQLHPQKKNNKTGQTILIPLGGDCQLGAALEVYGFKETSLFKWAKISPKQLANSLEDKFKEIYDTRLADFYVRPPNGKVGIVGKNKDIPLPRNGGWATHEEYLAILQEFDKAQEFHTAIIDKERGFTHGILVNFSDLLHVSKEEIRIQNQEKIDHLKNKTLQTIDQTEDEVVFLRAQRDLDDEIITELNRVYSALKTLRGTKPFQFVITTPDTNLHKFQDQFDKDIVVIFFDMFSPPDNPMLLRHSYPEWKKLFNELDLPIQGKFKKSILFSGFDA